MIAYDKVVSCCENFKNFPCGITTCPRLSKPHCMPLTTEEMSASFATDLGHTYKITALATLHDDDCASTTVGLLHRSTDGSHSPLSTTCKDTIVDESVTHCVLSTAQQSCEVTSAAQPSCFPIQGPALPWENGEQFWESLGNAQDNVQRNVPMQTPRDGTVHDDYHTFQGSVGNTIKNPWHCFQSMWSSTPCDGIEGHTYDRVHVDLPPTYKDGEHSKKSERCLHRLDQLLACHYSDVYNVQYTQ